MSKTCSRFKDVMDSIQPVMNGSNKRKGCFLQTIEVDGYKVMCILNFVDGFLQNKGSRAAVQCSDGYVEYWEKGQLHNTKRDLEGNLLPAIISQGGEVREYWIYGKQVNEKGIALEDDEE